jgi:predicted metalloprotease with PDZ domain
MAKSNILITLIFTLFSMSAFSTIHYHVSFDQAARHYVDVTMTASVKKGEEVTFSMPVWTPGSYKVRDFSQHIVEYSIEGGQLKSYTKNTYTVEAEEKGDLKFSYTVYAFEVGVRHSYVDLNYAFLHGVSAFMYIQGRVNEDVEVHFDLPASWKQIEVALDRKKGKPNTFCADDYDLLADSPFALGNFDVGTYETAGVPHRIVMIGEGNYDLDKVTQDFKTITDEQVKMFNGKHPCKQYVHFIQNVDQGGGGLEHLNSQTSQVNRWAYTNESRYKSFLGLISHEYFHLWNVKRIRPLELGPFDYETENYSTLLWVAEGITSYYDDLFLYRSGIKSKDQYLNAVAYNINRLQNQPGRLEMTLQESSKLAWVKAYLPNENSKNETISYYNKGMVVALLLDLEILKSTDNQKRLDDVMRYLMDEYYVKKKRGFTYEEFVDACSSIAGKDMKPFFKKTVESTEELDYSLLKAFGVTLNQETSEKSWLGLETKTSDGKTVVSYIHPAGPALKAGLSVNDEIISIDGWRVRGSLSDETERLEAGKTYVLIYARDMKMAETELQAMTSPEVTFTVKETEDASEEILTNHQAWLPPLK